MRRPEDAPVIPGRIGIDVAIALAHTDDPGGYGTSAAGAAAGKKIASK